MNSRRDNRSTIVELEINPGRANRARVNGGSVARPREILGLVRTVQFAPEDLALVKGDPGDRRRFLDELLVARAPRFSGVRADYITTAVRTGGACGTGAAQPASHAAQTHGTKNDNGRFMEFSC